jgi:hypothetical protein
VRQYLSQQFSAFVLLCILLIFVLGCEKKSDSVIESSGNISALSSPFIAPDTIVTLGVGSGRTANDRLTLSLIAKVKVTNPDGSAQIASVICTAIDPTTDEVLSERILLDDGVFPDVLAQDSIFSGSLAFTIYRYQVGRFIIQFSSTSNEGFQSSTAILPLEVVRSQNSTPVLSNLHAPDTVITSRVTTFLISVQAIDADGPADIKSVVRMTSSGNRYPLNDSGTNGDVTANDGIYSETVSVNPPPPPGIYTFRFQAVDLSNDSSNVLTKILSIIN